MQYSSLYYHLNPICHYLFAFILLFLIFPKWLFSVHFVDFGERIISRFVLMVFLVILSGYVLVVTKLYEVISIVTMLIIIVGSKYWLYVRKEQKPAISNLMKCLFDILDGIHYTNSSKIIRHWASVKLRILLTKFTKKYSLKFVIETSFILITFGLAFYIRFYDVFENAALPLADSYVTLAWMKYIDARQLFHDGIYPQGFHIYLATLLKFSSIDGVFVLRYTGPFNTLMITIGLYYVIRKLTGYALGALVATSVYGCLTAFIYWFPIERQVATNSQEFAFVFIYPVVYFLILYCLSNKHQYLYIGIIGVAIIGLIHSLAYAFMGLLIGFLIFCSILLTRTLSKQVLKLALYSLLTVVVALLPMALGIILGKDFHSTSLEYLLKNSNQPIFPRLVEVDYITMACLCIISLLLFSKRMTQDDRFISLFVAMSGFATFSIYYFGGSLTSSVLVASRSSELWGIMVPFIMGMTIGFLCKQLPKRWNEKTYYLYFGFLFIILFLFKPSPIIAYKLEYNANIEQYLKIRNMYRPKTWQMISNDEGYSVTVGSGFHMHIDDFINQYDPNREALTRIGEYKPDGNLAPNTFILLEKQMFKVSKSNSIYSIMEPQYRKRQLNYQKLKQWINLHKAANHPINIFYEDSDIIIYHLTIQTAKQKQDKSIWSD
jgi:hypothetical protein